MLKKTSLSKVGTVEKSSAVNVGRILNLNCWQPQPQELPLLKKYDALVLIFLFCGTYHCKPSHLWFWKSSKTVHVSKIWHSFQSGRPTNFCWWFGHEKDIRPPTPHKVMPKAGVMLYKGASQSQIGSRKRQIIPKNESQWGCWEHLISP